MENYITYHCRDSLTITVQTTKLVESNKILVNYKVLTYSLEFLVLINSDWCKIFIHHLAASYRLEFHSIYAWQALISGHSSCFPLLLTSLHISFHVSSSQTLLWGRVRSREVFTRRGHRRSRRSVATKLFPFSICLFPQHCLRRSKKEKGNEMSCHGENV